MTPSVGVKTPVLTASAGRGSKNNHWRERLTLAHKWVYFSREDTVKYLFVLICSSVAIGQDFNCDLKDYKRLSGLSAEMRGGTLELLWDGERGEQLKAALTIHDGQPLVTDLEARKSG